MKYSNIHNRIGTLVIFAFMLGITPFVKAQNTTQVIHMDIQNSPSVKVLIVASPNDDHKTVKNNNVQFVTMEKSDKMEIVSVKDMDSNSKSTLTEKTKVIQKMKREEIDQ